MKYILLTTISIILATVLGFVAQRGVKKNVVRYLSGLILILVIVSQCSTCSTAISQDHDNKELKDSINNLVVLNNKVSIKVDSIKIKLDSSATMVSNIKDAIRNAHFVFDSINNRLIPVKAQFYMHDAKFFGPTQNGNGNTQNVK